MHQLPFDNLPDQAETDNLIITSRLAVVATGLASVTRPDAVSFVTNFGLSEEWARLFDNRSNLAVLMNLFECYRIRSGSGEPRDPAEGGPIRHFMALSATRGARAISGYMYVYQPTTVPRSGAASSSVCLGCWVFPSRRGQGAAKSMGRAMAAMLFDRGYAQVCAEVRWDNTPSARALLASGFSELPPAPVSTTYPLSMGSDAWTRRFIKRADGKPAQAQDWPYPAQTQGWQLGMG